MWAAIEVTLGGTLAVLSIIAGVSGLLMGGFAQYRSFRAEKIRVESERAANTADAAAVGLKYMEVSIETMRTEREEDRKRIGRLEREVVACHERERDLRRELHEALYGGGNR